MRKRASLAALVTEHGLASYGASTADAWRLASICTVEYFIGSAQRTCLCSRPRGGIDSKQ
jgi:hypothetical protein